GASSSQPPRWRLRSSSFRLRQATQRAPNFPSLPDFVGTLESPVLPDFQAPLDSTATPVATVTSVATVSSWLALQSGGTRGGITHRLTTTIPRRRSSYSRRR